MSPLKCSFQSFTTLTIKMDSDPDNHENIIKSPPLKHEPTEGLGYEFFRCMQLHKGNIAQYIADTGEKDTYASLLRRCIRTALNLRSTGITKSDVICLCTYNHFNSCVPFIASLFLGIKVASLDPSLSIDDTSHLLKQVKPRIMFLVPEALKLIEKSLKKTGILCKLVVFGDSGKYQPFKEYLRPSNEEHNFTPENVAPKDTAVIFFSSGTTGLPKGICQSSYALLGQATNILDMDTITSVSLFYASLYWISAVVCLSSTILSGTARVVCKKFDGHQTWKLIQKYQISFIFMAPNQALEMYKSGRPDNIDTSSLLCLLTGGGTLPEKQHVLFRDLLPGTFICQAYGQTEVAGSITSYKMNDVKDALSLHYKPSSCGRPVPGMWLKVVDPETEEILGPHQEGELRVKSNLVMNGYFNVNSSDAFDNDGWLKTGDIVYYDDEQCFYIVDRLKEMLKYKSWHIAPTMLENILHNHPSIKKAVVIGIPHEEDGDHPMAVVILRDPNDTITGKEIEDYVASQVQDRQRLRAGVKFLTSIPVTPSGKVKRRELRNMILAGKL